MIIVRRARCGDKRSKPVEDCEQLPPTTASEKFRAMRGSVEVARFPVRGEAPSRFVRFNISLDETLIAKIDRAAKTRSTTRSGFIARAATTELEEGDRAFNFRS